MIFIAYDMSDRIMDVVKAESFDLAEAYWIGLGKNPKKIISEDNIVPLENSPNISFIKHIAFELKLKEKKLKQKGENKSKC